MMNAREKLNGQRTAGQIIDERLKGKNSSSERISALKNLIEEYRISTRMDVFVQVTSMLSRERGKQKSISKREPKTEGIMDSHGLVAAMCLSGSGGC